MSRLRWIGRVSQAQWVVVAMIVGVSLGWLFPDRPGAAGFRASDLQALSNVFLRMIK
jgi:Na+/H+-dicarboxylate symporter